MVRLCLVVLLALACTVLAKDQDGHTHHHYYDKVTNNVHHHSGKGDHHDDDDDNHHDDHDDHIYRFQIGDTDSGPYAYLDDHGHAKGAFIDLMTSVCKRAGKTCHYILDDHQRCWETKGDEEHPGKGLLFGGYDACIGLAPTPDRRNSFDFTKPFMKQSTVSFYFKDGHVPEFSKPANLTSQVIGFVNGWSLSPRCIRRHQKQFSGLGFTPKYYATHRDLVNAVKHDEVEAIFTGNFIDAAALHLAHGGPEFHCSEGLAVMAHYGSKVINWWNHALDELVKEFTWKTLCANAAEKHGDHGKIFCIED